MSKRGWIALVYRENGQYDSIVEGVVYTSEFECLKGIEKCKKEDLDNGWIYAYTHPIALSIQE